MKRIRDERGLSIVVSEQVLSFALDIADRVLVIENGEIVHATISATAVDAAQIAQAIYPSEFVRSSIKFNNREEQLKCQRH